MQTAAPAHTQLQHGKVHLYITCSNCRGCHVSLHHCNLASPVRLLSSQQEALTAHCHAYSGMQALAQLYPQQMYFPFKLSKQHYGPEGQGRAERLQPLLSSPLMEEWGSALNDTTYPAQRWEGWVGRLSGLVAAGDKVRLCLVVSGLAVCCLCSHYTTAYQGD